MYYTHERLRWLRETSGLTCAQVAELTGLNRTVVWSVETRTGEPSVATARTLASLYGVTVGWLLNGEGRVPSARSVRAAVGGR